MMIPWMILFEIRQRFKGHFFKEFRVSFKLMNLTFCWISIMFKIKRKYFFRN